jgi:3-dehydroquinate dehydratase-2
MKILVLNGPNLGRLGVREPEVYGSATHQDLADLCVATGQQVGADVEVRQTDVESEMMGWLFEAADSGANVVLNAGAWTHTSVALRDAASQVKGTMVEVHISNVHAREEFRKTSYLSDIATAVVVGMGFEGYAAAIRFIAQQAK